MKSGIAFFFTFFPFCPSRLALGSDDVWYSHDRAGCFFLFHTYIAIDLVSINCSFICTSEVDKQPDCIHSD